jgi:hypothetical protein
MRRSHCGVLGVFCLVAIFLLLSAQPAQAATFTNSACVEIQDPSGSLSWSNSVNALAYGT